MTTEHWYKQPKNKAHEKVFDTVRRTADLQSDVFDRHIKLEALYDPYSPHGDDGTDAASKLVNVQENVVASNIDTVHAAVATTEVRARIQTDGADWSTQRRARHQEFYAEGLQKKLGLHKKCRLAFKSAAKKGTGLVKVWVDRWNDIQAEHVAIEDIVVPDCDSRGDRPPLQMHHVMRNVDKDELAAEYPEHEDDIRNGTKRTARSGYTPFSDDKICVIESIRLPIGKKGSKGKAKYVPGRRVVCIEDKTLLDEKYEKPYYPLACLSWLSREGSFYGISLTERIAGIQRALNKRNWQIDRALDQNANLTTFVRPADAHLAVKTSKIGNIVAIRGDYPVTPAPPIVNPETYQSRIALKDAAFEESGVSRLAAQSHKPAGLDSGRALREYRDQTTQRFAPQEQDFEQLVLDVTFLALDCCKDLGDAAPVIYRQSRWKPKLEWSKVDMGDVKIQLAAASTLNRSPAGREQTLIEWAQAGVITIDEFRRLTGHADLERARSLYAAAQEAIEEQLEMILDGEIVIPEPFDNLDMAITYGNSEYKLARSGGAPEEILEVLRQYVSQAAYFQKVAQNQNMPAPTMPGDPAAAAPGPVLTGAGVSPLAMAG